MRRRCRSPTSTLDINTFEIWVSVRVDEKTPSLNFDCVCPKRVKK